MFKDTWCLPEHVDSSEPGPPASPPHPGVTPELSEELVPASLSESFNFLIWVTKLMLELSYLSWLSLSIYIGEWNDRLPCHCRPSYWLGTDEDLQTPKYHRNLPGLLRRDHHCLALGSSFSCRTSSCEPGPRIEVSASPNHLHISVNPWNCLWFVIGWWLMRW